MSDESTELLRDIRDELRAIHAVMKAVPKPGRTLKCQDQKAMAKILPVVAANFSGTFLTWNLLDCARVNDAFGANVRMVIGKRSAQVLGKLFGRAAGHTIGNIQIQHCGKGAHGVKWRCIVDPSS